MAEELRSCPLSKDRIWLWPRKPENFKGKYKDCLSCTNDVLDGRCCIIPAGFRRMSEMILRTLVGQLPKVFWSDYLRKAIIALLEVNFNAFHL